MRIRNIKAEHDTFFIELHQGNEGQPFEDRVRSHLSTNTFEGNTMSEEKVVISSYCCVLSKQGLSIWALHPPSSPKKTPNASFGDVSSSHPMKEVPRMELVKTHVKKWEDSDALRLLLCTLCRIAIYDPQRELLSKS